MSVASAFRRRASESLTDAPHRPRLPSCPAKRGHDLHGSLLSILGITSLAASSDENGKGKRQLIRTGRAADEAEEATLASFLRQYETGRKSLVDMLNSQRELTELRLQLVQIENDWLIVSMRLAALTGGLDRLAGIESL